MFVFVDVIQPHQSPCTTSAVTQCGLEFNQEQASQSWRVVDSNYFQKNHILFSFLLLGLVAYGADMDALSTPKDVENVPLVTVVEPFFVMAWVAHLQQLLQRLHWGVNRISMM